MRQLIALISILFSTAVLANPCRSIDYIPGVDGSIHFSESHLNESTYGIKTDYLIGRFDWKDDFDKNNAALSGYQMEIIAFHAARCFTDPQVGRFLATQIVLSANHDDAHIVLVDELISIKREIATVQLEFSAWVDQITSISEERKERLKLATIEAEENLLISGANALLGYIELLKTYDSSLGEMKRALVLTQNILTALAQSGSENYRLVAGRLKNNTNSVLDTYSIFFSEEDKEKLRKALDEIDLESETTTEDELSAIIEILSTMLDQTFENSSQFREIAIKLNIVFGRRFSDFFGNDWLSDLVEEEEL